MVIKNLDLSDEELGALEYSVGLSDQDSTSEVDEAIHALIGSFREVKEQLISHQNAVKNIETKYKCMMDEQAAKHLDEMEVLKSEINFIKNNNDSLERELDIANAKVSMIEVIFGRGAR